MHLSRLSRGLFLIPRPAQEDPGKYLNLRAAPSINSSNAVPCRTQTGDAQPQVLQEGDVAEAHAGREGQRRDAHGELPRELGGDRRGVLPAVRGEPVRYHLGPNFNRCTHPHYETHFVDPIRQTLSGEGTSWPGSDPSTPPVGSRPSSGPSSTTPASSPRPSSGGSSTPSTATTSPRRYRSAWRRTDGTRS